MKLLSLLVLPYFSCLSSGAALQELSLTPNDALLGRVSALARRHSDLVQVESLGSSREGREIVALRVTGPGEAAGRPAILLVANVEGPRLFAGEVALHHAVALAERYGEDEAARTFLDGTILYVVPRPNPDAAEARFATPLAERRFASAGVDNDRDGREGEDPSSDVNGDGIIASMRVLDPEGDWISDPTDARAMRQADPAKGERGQWKLYAEGRDLDGDERVAEDPPADAWVAHGFPDGWRAHEATAGRFPGDEPEVLALMDFVLAHPEIALVVSYDALDNLVETPKGVKDDARPVKRVPPAGLRESDAALVKELGRRYREATEVEVKSEASDEGTFARWCYAQRGLWTLSGVLWDMPTKAPEREDADEPEAMEEDGETAGEPAGEKGETGAAPAEPEPPAKASKKKKGASSDEEKPTDDAKRLTWIDGAGETERFLPWTPFEHPELGTVEIGGFAPYARLEPPEDEWKELADRHLAFLLGLGDALARVQLVECTRTALGGDLWRVEAVLQNAGLLPLLSRSGRLTRTTRPVKLSLSLPAGARLVAGRPRALVEELGGSGGRHEEVWLVAAPRGAELVVTAETDHAGRVERIAEVAE